MEGKTHTLQYYIEKIEDEIPYIDIKKYSHNIITLYLQAIDNNYGTDKANEVIKELKLNTMGWS